MSAGLVASEQHRGSGSATKDHARIYRRKAQNTNGRPIFLAVPPSPAQQLADSLLSQANCKLAFDAWSPALRGESLFDAAHKAAPLVALTTNADYIRVPRYRYRPELVNYERLTPDEVRAVPFGGGFIDYAAFFRGLVERGFDGPAAYEICSPIRGGGGLENLDACATTYLQWMRAPTRGLDEAPLPGPPQFSRQRARA